LETNAFIVWTKKKHFLLCTTEESHTGLERREGEYSFDPDEVWQLWPSSTTIFGLDWGGLLRMGYLL